MFKPPLYTVTATSPTDEHSPTIISNYRDISNFPQTKSGTSGHPSTSWRWKKHCSVSLFLWWFKCPAFSVLLPGSMQALYQDIYRKSVFKPCYCYGLGQEQLFMLYFC